MQSLKKYEKNEKDLTIDTDSSHIDIESSSIQYVNIFLKTSDNCLDSKGVQVQKSRPCFPTLPLSELVTPIRSITEFFLWDNGSSIVHPVMLAM